jgi:endonuclease YncB( thermonuclease family)
VIEGRARIVDGDTIVINKVQIRLFGIDAPEIDHPYGQKAKWALVSLCKGNTIRTEVTDVDSYGRTVGKCYLSDGRDLSAEMVKIGLAIDWPKFSGGEYRSMETSDARKKLWLADARQKGRMHVWESFDSKQNRAKQNEK